MFIDVFRGVFARHRLKEAIVWRGRGWTYGCLLERIDHFGDYLRAAGVAPGRVVLFEREHSPDGIALLFALIEAGCIAVPLTPSAVKRDEYMEVAQVEVHVPASHDDAFPVHLLDRRADHELYEALRERRHPGLVLFSSGSTGKPKAAVHDLVPLLDKFAKTGKRFRAISFLLFDHIGGINTVFCILSSGGCLVTVEDRSPDAVLHAVECHRVDLLPTTPTFLNLLLISEAYGRHDLSSLRVVSYGTEPMLESTLRRLTTILPGVKLIQMYGLSELGVLQSKSKSSDSLWVKLRGQGCELRVVDGVLQVKSRSAMLGYLNAPSPFTPDGWMSTGDRVEVDGEYFHILGRESAIINVGGQKVYPAEVESVIQEVEGVAEVSVFGEENRLIGQIVCARVTPVAPVEPKDFTRRIKLHCRKKLETFKVPVRVLLVDEAQHGERFKKMRGDHA